MAIPSTTEVVGIVATGFMKKKVLKNGLTVIFDKKQTNSVAISVTVRVGAKDEPRRIMGMSHFIEHMLFNGTRSRSALQVSSEIEAIGGELNALTSTEKTFIFVKVLNRHFDRGLEIISDIIQNPLFAEKDIEKERKIILDEVHLMHDQPRYYEWILFHKTLFAGSLGNEILGTKETVRNIAKKDITSFYTTNYNPRNIIVAVVGNVKNALEKVEQRFSGFKRRGSKRRKKVYAVHNKPNTKVEGRRLSQSYLVLGYKARDRLHRDSFALDIVKSILGRGQSGRLFQEIRAKRALAYEVGVHHEAAVNYGFFAVYVNTDKKNIQLVIKVILQEFEKLKKITKKQLQEAKRQVEGEFIIGYEDNVRYTEQLGFNELVRDASEINNYVRKIRKVKLADVRRVVENYLNNKYTLTILRQK